MQEEQIPGSLLPKFSVTFHIDDNDDDDNMPRFILIALETLRTCNAGCVCSNPACFTMKKATRKAEGRHLIKVHFPK